MKGKEIYESILEYADKDGNHKLNNVEFISIDEIIQMGFRFECCPYCGNIDAESHFCNKCKKRYTELDDAYWFAGYLRRIFKL